MSGLSRILAQVNQANLKKCFYLVRHAKSSWSDMNLADHDRPLNARGKRDAPFMAQKLFETEKNVDLLISSTAKRAKKTAKAFKDGMNIIDDIQLTRQLYHAHESDILDVINAVDDANNTILLFGHNPGFTYFANDFGATQIDNIPTCGIVKFVSEADSWMDVDSMNTTFENFIYPKLYQR